jgi:NAD(P)-dependent dehydrogenase (short-subunit alcohol dehydrogenase family)
VVCPGSTRTPAWEHFHSGRTTSLAEEETRVAARIPPGRIGRPEEMVGAVVWRCSEVASFITGHALAVDGARSAQ